GRPGRDIVDAALTALANLDHRGAVGAEEATGDGAGIMLQVPDAFFREVVDLDLPPAGAYAVGTAFLPALGERADAVALVERIAAEEGIDVLGWRTVPIDPTGVGPTARA